MPWANDAHGLVFKCSELKLYRNGGHTWAMKLSQLAKQKGTVRIVTYSLPDLDYAIKQLSRRPHSIYVVCHSKFISRAREIKTALPDIRIRTCNDVHSKVYLIEPKTIYVGSANFGNSHWHETIIGVRSKKAHDWYVTNSFEPLWNRCREVTSA